MKKLNQRQRRASVRVQIRTQKQDLQRRIEADRLLRRDFHFLVDKTGLKPAQLLTGLWLDCNLMKADRQTLLHKAKKDIWPISQDTLRRTIRNILSIARQIEATNKTDFSPLHTSNIGATLVGLPENLRAYAAELEKKVDIWAPYWRRKRARIPDWVASTRQNSLYERIRSSAGSYHQTRLLRLVNLARAIESYPPIRQRAFTAWLNRFEKRRKVEKH